MEVVFSGQRACWLTSEVISMSDDLTKRIARTWAAIDGNLAPFEACAKDATQDHADGHFSKYMMQADELLRRSGLAMEMYQLRAESAPAMQHLG